MAQVQSRLTIRTSRVQEVYVKAGNLELLGAAEHEYSSRQRQARSSAANERQHSTQAFKTHPHLVRTTVLFALPASPWHLDFSCNVCSATPCHSRILVRGRNWQEEIRRSGLFSGGAVCQLAGLKTCDSHFEGQALLPSASALHRNLQPLHGGTVTHRYDLFRPVCRVHHDCDDCIRGIITSERCVA